MRATKLSNGCRNCVKRRIRCDEKRPYCDRCSRSKLDCDGVPEISNWISWNESCPVNKTISSRSESETQEDLTHARKSASTKFKFVDVQFKDDCSLGGKPNISIIRRQAHGIGRSRTPSSANATAPSETTANSAETSDREWTIDTAEGCTIFRTVTDKLDPFDSLPGDVSPTLSDQIIKHAWHSTWPRLVRASSCPAASISIWMRSFVQSPLLFYANVFALSGPYVYQSAIIQQDVLRLRMQCYSQTLTLVSQAVGQIAEGGSKVSEELITATLILAAYSRDTLTYSAGRPASESSASAAIDPYFCHSNQQPENHHTAALRMFVDQKGGIGNIQSHGIADLICLHDLVIASIHADTPYYPCRWHSRVFGDLSKHSPRIAWGEVGTRAISLQVDAIKKMRRLLIELAKHEKSDTSKDKMKELNAACNEVQYTVLVLPEDSFRTAALLFSDLVFFPAPAAICKRDKFAEVLRRQLPERKSSGLLNLWMATIGALNSEWSSPTNEYFVELIAHQASRQGISELPTFYTRLSEVLWQADITKLSVDSIWQRVGL